MGTHATQADKETAKVAIVTAERLSGKPSKFLGRLRRKMFAPRITMLTAIELGQLNKILTRLGADRISVAVHDAAKIKRRYVARRAEINATHDALVAARPLKPPGR